MTGISYGGLKKDGVGEVNWHDLANVYLIKNETCITLQVCVHTCMSVCVCVCAYMYVCVCVCVCVHLLVCVFVSIRTIISGADPGGGS